MPSNESIAQKSQVLLMSSPNMALTVVPRTFMVLTPSIMVNICYLSVTELSTLKNRIEVKLDEEKITELCNHFQYLLGGPLRYSVTYEYWKEAHSFVTNALKMVQNKDAQCLYVSIPLLEKSSQPCTLNAYLKSNLVQYHRKLFGSLIFATSHRSVVTERLEPTIPEPLTNIKDFFQLPAFSVVINGEHQSPCALCGQNVAGNHDSCIFYTSNYECLFTADLPIVVPEVQTSKLAAIMTALNDEDLQLLTGVDSEDDVEKAWLKSNPEYAGLESSADAGGETDA